jgi:glucan phosphoethanolaminetransferase (alkaline phosphatase superfamily)
MQDPYSHQDGSRVATNYFFFVFLFVLMALPHSAQALLIERQFSFSQYFFLVYGLAQCFVETLLVFWLYHFLQTMGRTSWKALFLVLSYSLVALRLVDFMMERLMDMSIWYALDLAFKERSGNFFELLKASSISIAMWIAALLAFFCFIGAGVFSYLFFKRLSLRWPWALSRRLLFSVTAASMVFLVLWDVSFFSMMPKELACRYKKTLPWKHYIIPRDEQTVLVDSFLKSPDSEDNSLAQLDSRPFALQHKPDIFLFVVESLREDYISEEIAPAIACFRKDHISFARAFSNANATHLSWFSLFYSLYPFYFPSYQVENWQQGSLPLTFLTKVGYKIHVLSSSRLQYYNMDEILFGKKRILLSSCQESTAAGQIPACEGDRRVMETLCQEIKASPKQGGRVFIVFLDSTHFGYSWPSSFAAPYAPCEEGINYFKASFSSTQLENIKNRYRNSLAYVDSLFAQFVQTMKAMGCWEDSVVVFTADHGEEFYEQGNLFHASALTKEQVHVPLYYKLGKTEAKALTTLTSHMDIFPTIFHYLIGEDSISTLFQGSSIFSKKEEDFVVAARFNAARAPYEFFIHNGSYKLLAQFASKDDALHSRELRILSAKDANDHSISLPSSALQEHFGNALQALFSQ